MKHTIKTAALILLITSSTISCSKDAEVVYKDQTSISVPSEPSEPLPVFPTPKKNLTSVPVE